MRDLSTNTTSCIVYNDYIEPEAIGTIYKVLHSSAFAGSPVRIMPDVHEGKGIVVGFTAPLTNWVNPNHVGVDIGCCIDLWKTGIKVSSLTQEDLEEIERKTRMRIPFGMEIHEKSIVDTKDFLRFLNRYVAKCASTWHLITPKTYTEKDIEKFCAKIGIGVGVFWKSLGTVGSGNHYIEFGKDDEDNFFYSIHCGSRNLGLKIAKFHCKKAEKGNQNEFKHQLKEVVKKAKNTGKTEEIPDVIEAFKEEWKKDHIEGYLTGNDMCNYLDDMVVGMAYSLYNHQTIAKIIREILAKWDVSSQIIPPIVSVHNYIDMEDHMIRKGAIRAYERELMVVPFNMRDGLAVCEGKGNEEWNFSCAHGAGRKMSRSAAKAQLDVEEFQQQMDGIVSTSVGNGTLDEAPNAYKDTEEIKSLISDTCKILYMVKPVINLKATE